MSQKILLALALLEVANAEHWTDDGLPRLDIIQQLSDTKDLTRADLTALAPSFNRTNPVLDGKGTDGVMPPPNEDAEQAKIDMLKAQVREKQADLERQQAVVRAEQNKLAGLTKETDELLQQLGKHESDTPAKNQRDIAAFLAQQHQNRVDRHAKQQALLRGVDPSLLGRGSRLDQSLARKNGRGAARPSYPGKAG